MPILCSQTYDIITPESAEEGDVADSGFEYEGREFTFRELVSELKRYTEMSCSDHCMTGDGIPHCWATYCTGQDMWTGGCTDYALHFDRGNPPWRRKYWRKALIAAGLIKRGA